MPEPLRVHPETPLGAVRAPEHSRAGYEEQDIRFRPIVITVLALGIVLGIAAYSAYRDVVWQKRQYRSPEPTLRNTALPAEPRLEQLEPQSLERESSFRAQEQARIDRLRQYGSAEESGHVRVPIEKAMERLVAREQEKRDSANKSPRKSRGLVGGGDSNSGRLFSEDSR